MRTDPTRAALLQGRAGKMVQRADATHDGHLRDCVARFPPDRPSRSPATSPACARARRRTASPRGSRRAPLTSASAARQRHDPHFAVRSHRRGAHSRRGRQPDGRDLRHRHRLPPRAAHAATASPSSTKPSTADGEPITWSQPPAACWRREFVNDGKTYQAVWFRGAAAQQGRLLRLDGRACDAPSWPRRWSSRASPRASRCACTRSCRLWRQHIGVDYAAPTGTPVRSVGDGVVEFAGWQNGYGNVVIIKHGNDRSTRLRAPEPHRRAAGQRVEPGRAHRRGRLHRLGDRPAPALRVPGQRRARRIR